MVFALDREYYQYAFVCGPNTDYLWLLSRKPNVRAALIDKFVETARIKGFETDKLIFVDHED